METSKVCHVLGKKIAYMSMFKENTSSNTSIYPVVEDNNIYRVLQVGRNYGPRFLKGRLALCVAYDSLMNQEVFLNYQISVRGGKSY